MKSSTGVGCIAALLMAGCVVASGDGSAEQREADAPVSTAAALSGASDGCWETTLAWGDGAGQVGLVPAAPERAARGAQAIALGGDGEVFVLDNVNGRVLAVDSSGEARVAVGKVAAHSEDLAIGPDGAIATYSPLLATVSIAEPSGTPAGELNVDRTLRHVRGISLLSSRRVLVHTAHQETLPVGSPAAPLALPATLHGKREGAAPLPDDRGLVVRAVHDGTVALQVVRASALDATAASADRQRVVATLPVPGTATAGRIVGAVDGLACVTLEQVGSGAPVSVARRVACLELASPPGAVVLDEALAAPAVYQPARPVVLGGTPLSLASIQPGEAGLVVRSCRVSRQVATEVSR